MKIAFDGRVLKQKAVTGVQRYAIDLLREVTRIVGDTSVRPFFPNFTSKFRNHLWEQFNFPREAFQWGADVILAPGNLCPVYLTHGIKRVTVIHDLSYLYFPEAYSFQFKFFYNLLIPMVIKKSDIIITVSKSELNAIVEVYPSLKNKIYYVQNGVGSEFYEEPVKKNPLLLYVGSLSQRKNFDGLIEAFSNVVNTIPHDLVLIGGFGDIFRKKNKLSSVLNKIPEGRIKFLGQVNDIQTLRHWYSRSELFVFPSFYEASPLPPLEAMACGCPVLASDIPSIKERCGDAAYYCDPNSSEDISAKIIQLCTNQQKRERLRDLGLAHVQNFSWEKCAQETLEIIQTLF